MATTTNVDSLKINILTKAQYDAATKDINQLYLVTDDTIDVATTSTPGLMSAEDKAKLDGLTAGSGGDIVIDSELSSTSTNPVQNRVVNAAISNLNSLVGDTSVSSQITTAIENKKAFSNVTVGSTTITADSTTDTLTLAAGDNITLTPDATNDKVTIAAKDTVYTHPSYTARTGVPTANATPAFGGTFSVSQPVSDATGHITAINSRTITIPSATATTSAAGLMSASDKAKLDGISSGASDITVDSELSTTSTNPVQNKVVTSAINNLNTLVGDTSVAEQINAAQADMVGATSSAAGSHGLVPAPAKGANLKYLRGDGTWQTVNSYINVNQTLGYGTSSSPINLSTLGISNYSVLYFEKGTYYVKPLSLSSKSHVTFLMQEAEIIATGTHFVSATECNDIQILGGKISNATQYAIQLQDCNKPIIRSVEVANIGDESCKDTAGIKIVGNCTGFQVDSNYVHDITSGVVYSDGYIHAYGIFINRLASTNAYSKSGLICDNVIENIAGIDSADKKADGDGIFIQNPPYLDGSTTVWMEPNIIVERNTITNCKKRGIKVASPGVTIRNCTFEGAFWYAAIDFQYGHGKAIDCNIKNTSNYTGATTAGITATDGGVEIIGCAICCPYTNTSGKQAYQNGIRLNPRLSASVIGADMPWDRFVVDNCYFNQVANAINVSNDSTTTYTLKALEIIDCRFGTDSNTANVIGMGAMFSSVGTFRMVDFRFDAGSTRTDVKNFNSSFTYPASVISYTTDCYELYSRYWADSPVAGNATMPTSPNSKIIFSGNISGIFYKCYTAHGSEIWGSKAAPSDFTATLAKQLLYNSKIGDLYHGSAGGVYVCTTAGASNSIGTWTAL